ncbi:MAG: heparinase II/III family protein [Proteobacteria bacterium]|nr:heparinase II/III family protein [Pseudomonadota bacterium]
MLRTLAWVSLVTSTIVACSDDAGSPGPSFPENHPRVYLPKHKERLKQALAAGAPEAKRFAAMVDKWIADPVGADIYNFEEWNAALMGQLTDDPKYCAAAVASLDKFVTSEEAIIAQGEAPVVVNDSYLQIGHTIGNVALTIDYCYDAVGDKRTRWLAYANQAVWNVWHPADAVWGGKKIDWSGWSIDNPVNNYYYSFLRATMLLGLVAKGEVADADAWIVKYRDEKILGELVPVFERDLQGGGSREGTGYGVSMRNLFETFDLWSASTGENLSHKTSHTRDSMLAMMHETVPTLDRTAPIGDHTRDSSAALFDYHRQYLVELMSLFPGDPITGYARTFLDACSVPKMDQQFMYVFDMYYPISQVTAKPLDTLNTAYWAPGIGNLYARSSWDAHASWVALVAGPYTESHAHQDQGSILFFKDQWLAYDPNTETGSGIRAENEAHNLVRILDGDQTIHQHDGTVSNLVGLRQGTGYVYAAADLTPAYTGEAKVQKVQRELVFIEPDILVVYDRVNTGVGTNLLWQVASPVAATPNGHVAAIVNDQHTLKVTNVVPGIDAANVHAFQDDDSDYRGGYRIDFPQPGGDRRYLTVMSVDGAAISIAADGADGVAIQTAGGTAKVSFAHDAIGATYTPAGGSAIALGATVAKLPETR